MGHNMTPDPIVLSAGLNQNFQLFRAEDKVLQVTMFGYDLPAAIAIEWWLARSPYAVNEDVFIKKTKTAGITIAGTNLEIAIAAADTAELAPDIYYHELRIIQADAATKVAMTGNVAIRMSLDTTEVTP